MLVNVRNSSPIKERMSREWWNETLQQITAPVCITPLIFLPIQVNLNSVDAIPTSLSVIMFLKPEPPHMSSKHDQQVN